MLKQTYLIKPEDIGYEFCRAWNERNAFSIANLFTEDAEFVNVVGLWWHDRKSIWKAHDYGLKVIFPNSHLEVRQVKTRFISQNVALVHAKMKLIGQTGLIKDSNPGDRQNIFSFVLEKKEEGWICISAHNTDVVPGKETNIIDSAGNLKAVDYRRGN